MPRVLLVRVATQQQTLVSLAEAARISQLDPDEVGWALEEFGRCDTDEWAILPENTPYIPLKDDDK